MESKLKPVKTVQGKEEGIEPEAAAAKAIPKTRWKKIVKRIEKVTLSQESLTQFVSEETSHRKKDRKSAITKNLSQDDWKQLRAQVKDKLGQMEGVQKPKQILQQTKKTLLYWIVNPSLKGAKPPEWANYV